MNYYINPIWFYLIQISGCLNIVLFVCAVLFIGGVITLYIIDFVFDDEEILNTRRRSGCKKFILASIIMFILAILCPTEKTCLRMMVAATVNKENVASVKEEIYDIVDYIDEKLDDNKE